MTGPPDLEGATAPVLGPSRVRRLAVQGAAVFAVALVLYGALGAWVGTERLAGTFDRISPGALLPLVGLVLLGWGLRALRWHLYVRRLELPIPLGASLHAFLASFAFTATPGKAGEVVKSLLLRSRFAVAVTATAGALLAERLVDLLAVLALALGGLGRAETRLYLAASAALLAVAVLFVVNERMHQGVVRWLRRLPAAGRAADPLARFLGTGRRLLEPTTLALALALAVVAWGCEGVVFYRLLRLFGAEVSLGTALTIFSLATLVGALSMLPGGLGGFEATMLLLLASLEVKSGAAVGATVVLRLLTLWLVSLLGAFFLGLWWLGGRRRPSRDRDSGLPPT
jgi:uncharacterized protein (TIRG00374 family)